MIEHIRKYKYSEIFFETVQGEATYCGVPTVWLRFFGCHFECAGFGQKDPTDKSTWEYDDLDLSKYKSMEELPVLKFGCDSAYSISKKFSHLAHQDTARDIAKKLTDLMVNEYNPSGSFCHETSNQYTHLAFTGGEPMLQQNGIVDVLYELHKMKNAPLFITIETNGTREIKDCFKEWFSSGLKTPTKKYGTELFFSISPKLFLSGEKWEDAIKPDVVKQYHDISIYGQLKYVCDGSSRSWDEIAKATKLYRDLGINYPVWIMPVGGLREEQEKIQAEICNETVKRGYNFSPRVHCWIFGNQIGK